MQRRTRVMATAIGIGALTFLAACGGGGGGEEAGGGGATAGGAGGEISMQGCTPQEAMWPGSTNETCGGNVLDAVQAKLIHYNSDNAAPENDIAESIESDDNQNFTVKIKKDYMFSDGTEVKARNFVDAWNFTANGVNGQANSYFFGVVEGYEDLQCGTDKKGEVDCEGQPPKADELTGLEIVDDYTFTIKTTEKVSNLPVRLGYTAFAPLPDSFLDGDEATRKEQGKVPVGAGPFKVTESDTQHIVLERNEHYSGQWKPSVDKVDYVIYADANAAYADLLGGNLDFMAQIPADYLVGDQYKTDLPERNLTRAQGSSVWLVFSPDDDQLVDNLELRKAISMAVDRDTIIKQVLNGTAEKSTGWVPSIVDGYQPDVCGEPCNFDAAKAKQMFEDAGGYEGTLTLGYNADGDNKAWAEAAANSIKNTLGIEVVAQGTPTFAEFLDKLDAHEVKGIFRMGWQMDYPSIENWLAPIYSKNADSNYAKYNNPEFEKLLKEAAAADSTEAGNKLYQDAEKVLAKDFPTAPLWSTAAVAGWSEKVTNVKVTAFGTLDLSSIKIK